MFINEYRCHQCGHEWSDSWPQMVNDDCPKCGAKNNQPVESKDAAMKAECGNCGWTGAPDRLNAIADIEQRVSSGEETPAGECPECGSLAHLIEDSDGGQHG